MIQIIFILTDADIKNLGSSGCWGECGNKGGSCDSFCGTEGACCRFGWKNRKYQNEWIDKYFDEHRNNPDPPECVTGCKGNHCCVRKTGTGESWYSDCEFVPIKFHVLSRIYSPHLKFLRL